MGFMVLVISSLTIILISNKDDININKTENGKHNLKKVKQIAEYEYDSQIICEAFDEGIKYFNYDMSEHSGRMVTNSNNSYIFYSYNLYSNNTNCIKVDDKFPNVRQIVRDFEKETKTYYNDEFRKIYITDSGVSLEDDRWYFSPWTWENHISDLTAQWKAIDEYGYIKIQTTPSTLGIRGDNNIYGFVLWNKKPASSYEYDYVLYNNSVIFSVAPDEVILDFYYTPNIYVSINGFIENYYGYNDEDIEREKLKNFILTDKSFYRYKLVDEKCEQYIDIECSYELVRDDELSKYRNDILFWDPSMIITSDGRIYYPNLNNYGY